MPRNSSVPPAEAAARPEKPHEGYPLFAHPTGYWAKKIKKKLHYFARWGKVVDGRMQLLPGDHGASEALLQFNKQYPDILAGRARKKVDADAEPEDDVFRVEDLCNDFLAYKLTLLETEEISPRTFTEYRQTTDRLVAFFGPKQPVDSIERNDFVRLRASIAKKKDGKGGYGPVRLGNEIVRIRSVFKYSRKLDLVPEEFRKPKAKVLRSNKRETKRYFEASEIKKLIEAAPTRMKAMILLGVNCAFGNSDISDLQQSHVDLQRGWVDFPRPKTEIERRCRLWPETVSALKAAIAERPAAASRKDVDCVFLTHHGHRYVREKQQMMEAKDGSEQLQSIAQTNEVAAEFNRLFDKPAKGKAKGKVRSGVVKRDKVGFYSFRHTFRTVADGTRDFPAVRMVMGHYDSSIDGNYREHIEDARLVAVADYVHAWLFGAEKGGDA